MEKGNLLSVLFMSLYFCYAGERIGVEYLLHQNSQTLVHDMDPAVWQLREGQEEEEEVGDEGFVEEAEDEDQDHTVFAEFDRPGQQTMESNRPSRLST